MDGCKRCDSDWVSERKGEQTEDEEEGCRCRMGDGLRALVAGVADLFIRRM